MEPIEFNRFLKAVQRVSDTLSYRSSCNLEAILNDYIYVKAGKRGKLLKIDLDDIDFVEVMSNYVSFSKAGEKTLAYLKLKDLESSLLASQFMRAHRSFIVSLRQISKMEHSELVIKTKGQRIPIGAIYKEQFLERMKNKLMSSKLLKITHGRKGYVCYDRFTVCTYMQRVRSVAVACENTTIPDSNRTEDY